MGVAFRKILIANRGEIAVRIAQACRELGIVPVAVYSDADVRAAHVRAAAEAVRIGPPPARESYLNVQAVIDAARASGAQAIHPGYGFLSERPELPEACAAAGLVFIGPPAPVIRLLGDKVAAKQCMRAAGVPVVPGSDGGSQDLQRLEQEAAGLRYPIMVKAAAGGGGKGMRVVRMAGELRASLEGAAREAQAAFGNSTLFLEQFIDSPRHVEVQILADAHGTVLALGERECSIQRRHQKVLEESPSPALDPARRKALLDAAVKAGRASGYVNAGTVEFILAPGGEFHFLEVNTRLQVEHPVTELVTGLDLVMLQIAVAAGEKLTLKQDQVNPRGHAIEVRLYAEDPAHGYLPTTGIVHAFDPPQGPGVRNDVGLAAGDEVGIHYDPLLAKLIVWAGDRTQALARLSRALEDYRVDGLTTNLDFLRWLVRQPDVLEGRATTSFLDAHPYAPSGPAEAPLVWRLAAAFALSGAAAGGDLSAWRAGRQSVPLRVESAGEVFSLRLSDLGAGRWRAELGGNDTEVEIHPIRPGRFSLQSEGASHEVTYRTDPTGAQVSAAGHSAHAALAPALVGAGTHHRSHGTQTLTAPMPGAIIRIDVAEGQDVHAHQRLVVLEAMKMEHTLVAPEAGRVKRLPYKVGDIVPLGAVLVEMVEA